MENVFHSAANANDDGQLVSRVVQGDRAALGLLYDRHATLLYSLALRMLVDETEAREVFLSVWSHVPVFRPERGSFFSWAVSQVRSQAIERLRARRRRGELREVDRPELDLPGFGANLPDYQDEVSARTREVRSAIGQLSEDERQVLRLAFFEGLTQAEMAEKLEEPLTAIKACVYRGLTRMRTILRFAHE
jgi:RNA polymerase sigma-70 factor (ECF subfamily)